MTNKRKIINDPVHGFLTIEDDIIYDIIEHPYFQRQRHIKQLGFSYLVYPGTVHTRFAHMLGALNLMGRALDVLKVKGVEITPDEALGVKIAILLHDVGHGPFSHTSECVLADVHHETLTRLFMERLNHQMGGQLTTAIRIFEDSYPKRFLHQLVSSQLDMDRLDYLNRDSFFSGVSEGIVGIDRIINMLNVVHDELVVDEKGIYSIEKFIISRRLMYWQVYLHKTVVAADVLLLAILRRAKELLATGHKLGGSDELLLFLSHNYKEIDFERDPQLLEAFALLDDSDIMSAVKSWMLHSTDPILHRLCENLVNRRLSRIRIANHPFGADTIEELHHKATELYGLKTGESSYFVTTGVLENHAYSFNDQEIMVRFKDGHCLDISEASDQLDRRFLEKTVTKYYVYYPRDYKQ